MEYYREYKGHIVAKYGMGMGKWIYVVWNIKERLFQCESFNEAKEWIDGATQ